MTAIGLIGLAVFVAGFLVGRWWFAVSLGIIVFIAGAAFSDLEADPVEFGLLAGVLASLLALAGTGVRLVANEIVKGMRARRTEGGSNDVRD